MLEDEEVAGGKPYIEGHYGREFGQSRLWLPLSKQTGWTEVDGMGAMRSGVGKG